MYCCTACSTLQHAPPLCPIFKISIFHFPFSRVGNAEFNLAQGAFRSGNYKYLANEICSGWFTFDKHTNFQDPLTNVTNQCGGSACKDCGQSCTNYDYSDYLFDVVADPREETNLIEVYPEVSSVRLVRRLLFHA